MINHAVYKPYSTIGVSKFASRLLRFGRFLPHSDKKDVC
jgi:hypothetical protein